MDSQLVGSSIDLEDIDKRLDALGTPADASTWTGIRVPVSAADQASMLTTLSSGVSISELANSVRSTLSVPNSPTFELPPERPSADAIVAAEVSRVRAERPEAPPKAEPPKADPPKTVETNLDATGSLSTSSELGDTSEATSSEGDAQAAEETDGEPRISQVPEADADVEAALSMLVESDAPPPADGSSAEPPPPPPAARLRKTLTGHSGPPGPLEAAPIPLRPPSGALEVDISRDEVPPPEVTSIMPPPQAEATAADSFADTSSDRTVVGPLPTAPRAPAVPEATSLEPARAEATPAAEPTPNAPNPDPANSKESRARRALDRIKAASGPPPASPSQPPPRRFEPTPAPPPPAVAMHTPEATPLGEIEEVDPFDVDMELEPMDLDFEEVSAGDFDIVVDEDDVVEATVVGPLPTAPSGHPEDDAEREFFGE